MTAAASTNAARRIPRLVALDLDFTVWQPEMYELWGGGAPFGKCPKSGRVTDRKGTEVTIFEGARQALLELHTKEEYKDTLVAYASKCDEPEWADECMDLLELTPNGPNLRAVCQHFEIYKGSKKTHFRALHKKTNIPYEDMIFFDNQRDNIRDVETLGVTCVYTPDGMGVRDWEKGLKQHAARKLK